MNHASIYLDYNASAPLLPQAKEVMIKTLDNENKALNASAVHYFGREGRKIVEEARIHCAQLVGTQANQIIFNSGATEGNNTVLNHFRDGSILISAIEHPSILETAQTNQNAHIIPVRKNGQIDVNKLEELLIKYSPKLVSCMLVNNETGAIQNVSEISKLTNKYNAFFHCDATQAVGRIPVSVNGIDFLTFSSHKIGGPQGVGALALGLCGQTPTLLHGGGQEKSARAGTENVAGIVGFGAAAQYALKNLDSLSNQAHLRDKLENKIKQISPEVIIHCENTARIANTCFVSLPDHDSQKLLIAFDLEGIAISNGSACSSGTVKPSHVLMAMTNDEKIASSALRISIGWATKESDIDAFLIAWEKIYKRIKG